jgi:hypothetical protein
LATEWIAVSTAEEAAQWHTPTPDQQKARGLFSNCQGFMRRPTFNRRALANHQGIRSHLNEIKALELSHLSASVLSFYANLQSNPKASLQASLEWVNALSAKVMISGSNRYSKRFKNEICDRALEQIRRISPNLNSKVKPLVSALVQFIEKQAMPFCRVTHKDTATGGLKYRKLVDAIGQWRRLYNESQRAASRKARRPSR